MMLRKMWLTRILKLVEMPSQWQVNEVMQTDVSLTFVTNHDFLCSGVFVRIKGEPLHPECFKCCRCGKNLKNQGICQPDWFNKLKMISVCRHWCILMMSNLPTTFGCPCFWGRLSNLCGINVWVIISRLQWAWDGSSNIIVQVLREHFELRLQK